MPNTQRHWPICYRILMPKFHPLYERCEHQWEARNAVAPVAEDLVAQAREAVTVSVFQFDFYWCLIPE